MSQKVNIFPIFKEHHKVFRDARTGKISLLDIVTFYIFPFLISAGVVKYLNMVSSEMRSYLTTFVSITVGFLISALALLFVLNETIRNNHKTSPNTHIENEINVIKEASMSIMYGSLVGGLLVLFLMISGIENPFCNELCAPSSNFFSLALFIHFFLVFLMVLKRLFVMITIIMNKSIT